MNLTDFHAKYLAHELTKGCTSDSVEKLVMALADAQVDLIRAMAEHKPERVVCLDDSFAGNDQLKADAVQIFKAKGVTRFKTV